jgi:hypothetical protein
MEDKRILIGSIPGVFNKVVYVYKEDFFEGTLMGTDYSLELPKIAEFVNSKMGYEFVRIISVSRYLEKSKKYEKICGYIWDLIDKNTRYIYSESISFRFECLGENDLFFCVY